ncbi:hypothetical protein EDC04DRAFT_874161 [Pisolithus marmoratus]|nr:hypothetical protein EDC04DRAFT_874161 [Pisolithus marmoratus]
MAGPSSFIALLLMLSLGWVLHGAGGRASRVLILPPTYLIPELIAESLSITSSFSTCAICSSWSGFPNSWIGRKWAYLEVWTKTNCRKGL